MNNNDDTARPIPAWAPRPDADAWTTVSDFDEVLLSLPDLTDHRAPLQAAGGFHHDVLHDIRSLRPDHPQLPRELRTYLRRLGCDPKEIAQLFRALQLSGKDGTKRQ